MEGGLKGGWCLWRHLRGLDRDEWVLTWWICEMDVEGERVEEESEGRARGEVYLGTKRCRGTKWFEIEGELGEGLGGR